MVIFSLLFLLGFKNDIPASDRIFVEDPLISEVGYPMSEAEGPNFNSDTKLDSVSYEVAKADIGELRHLLKVQLKQGQISLDSIKTVFTAHLVDRIIPHWYGTPWSFGGHTPVPKQGEIACGYFISTTLRDMGLKLNRYKLAQKSPIDEAKVISCGTVISKVMEESPEKAIEAIDQITREGLHFIGFDTGHVGFLLKRDGEMFLIHSNYLRPYSVCIEPIEDSSVFKKFSVFHLVDISNNETLMQRWLDNTVIL